MSLLRRAVFRHMHVDWYVPGDWIGTPGFVVKPEQGDPAAARSITAKLLGVRERLVGCLAATPDPAPAAWVRVAAIAEEDGAKWTLAEMLALAAHNLRKTAVSTVAWLAIDDWPNSWLADFGFEHATDIETYVKEDKQLPPVAPIPELIIREVRDGDMARLAELEAEAFSPLWRHSARGLRLARQQAFSFDVAELNGRIVGFQLSTPNRYGVHLVRLTVDPNLQRGGIGSALLANAFREYHRRNNVQVTLNTQVDNAASQRLYKKFGFRASGQRFPVWIRQL